MKLSMTSCKHRLAALWFSGGGTLFFIILLQNIFGRYGARAADSWSWFLPTIVPTLSLVIGVLVMDTLGRTATSPHVDAFLFKLTYAISCVYLTAVLLVFLLQPFSAIPPFELMTQANLWLGPLQGLVAGSMGAFFVKAPESNADIPKNVPNTISQSGIKTTGS